MDIDVASVRLRAVTVDLSHPVVQAWGGGTAGLIEEDVYEVEELIGKRKRDGKVDYSWEASDKISDDLISDYTDCVFRTLRHVILRNQPDG